MGCLLLFLALAWLVAGFWKMALLFCILMWIYNEENKTRCGCISCNRNDKHW
jgi:uncharacterized membrane protein